MRSLSLILTLAFLLLGGSAEARRVAKPARSSKTVRTEQKSAQRAIEQTSSEIEANRAKTARELRRLESIRADIDRNHRQVTQYEAAIKSIDERMVRVNDSIAKLNEALASLRADYARELRRMQPSMRPMGRLTFIFGGKSIGEMYRRMRYAGEFNRWRRERVAQIQRKASQLDSRRRELETLESSRREALNDLHKTRTFLGASETQTRGIVAGLQKDAKSLNATLAERQRRARELDGELNRLITAEQQRQRKAAVKPAAKPAAKSVAKAEPAPKPAPTPKSTPAAKPAPAPAAKPVAKTEPTPNPATAAGGSFAASKGRLMSPLTGGYKVVKPFGRQKHPDLPNVIVDNPGVDLETAAGATARAVFAGTVSAIFRQEGYNTIVMIRHGDYLTIYGGLDAINVRSGQMVTAGQTIGRLSTDAGRSILHFEVRHERDKLNPMAWIK